MFLMKGKLEVGAPEHMVKHGDCLIASKAVGKIYAPQGVDVDGWVTMEYLGDGKFLPTDPELRKQWLKCEETV